MNKLNDEDRIALQEIFDTSIKELDEIEKKDPNSKTVLSASESIKKNISTMEEKLNFLKLQKPSLESIKFPTIKNLKESLKKIKNDFKDLGLFDKNLDEASVLIDNINSKNLLKDDLKLFKKKIKNILDIFSKTNDKIYEKVLKLKENFENNSTFIILKEELTEIENKIINTISKKKSSSSIFKITEEAVVFYEFSPELEKIQKEIRELGITGDEIGNLTSSMLKDKSFKNVKFRGYSVDVPIKKIIIGKANPYSQFLESVKDKLVSLGFKEFDSGMVTTEFWNSDALFMPQFHSSRDIHDVYRIKNPQSIKELEEPFLERVAKTHENGWTTGSRGWDYKFDKDFTKRLVLRSQGTAVSSETLKIAETPSRYFGILRCFRVDQVDATHLSDFYQTEGIVVSKEVNLRSLLGYLEIFAKEIAGASEVKYVPGYFPFTEPSVEIHIKHPVLGWFELGGAGIFRPEVTKPQGIDVPVLAWGLGIDRMALMHLGLNDLRELFSKDIDSIKKRNIFI